MPLALKILLGVACNLAVTWLATLVRIAVLEAIAAFALVLRAQVHSLPDIARHPQLASIGFLQVPNARFYAAARFVQWMASLLGRQRSSTMKCAIWARRRGHRE